MSVPLTSIRSSFIGRERDLAALARLIRQPAIRLVTVTGPGGVGKTRVVSELVPQLQAEYPGGVWFVPIAAIRDPELVLATIAAELGIRDIDAGETLMRVVERLGT